MIWKWNGWRYHRVTLHNAHLGTPAILACNGPSFAGVDASRLCGPGRIVVGVNNVYPALRPDYWFGLDAPDCFDRRLLDETFPKLHKVGLGDMLVDGRPLKTFPGAFMAELVDKAPFWDWSEHAKLHWCANSFLSALHFTLWMGVREIAFVGVDLSHAKGDYADGSYLTEEQRARNTRLHNDTLAFLREFAGQAATLGVRCVSCSPESRVNEFLPYRPVPEMLAEWEARCGSGRVKSHCGSQQSVRRRNVVLVLRSGGDFRAEHVHRLVGMLKGVGSAERGARSKTMGRRAQKKTPHSPLPIPHLHITLLTDLPARKFPGLTVIPLKHPWTGWWSKMELYRPDVLPGEPFLYLDLDTNVRDLPDKFFLPSETVVLKPFTIEEWRETGAMQTGLMLLQPADRATLWQRWMRDPAGAMARHKTSGRLGGDQGWWHANAVPWRAWQDVFPGAVASYKQNVLAARGYDGKLDREAIRVLCFHGKPRPWECEGK